MVTQIEVDEQFSVRAVSYAATTVWATAVGIICAVAVTYRSGSQKMVRSRSRSAERSAERPSAIAPFGRGRAEPSRARTVDTGRALGRARSQYFAEPERSAERERERMGNFIRALDRSATRPLGHSATQPLNCR